MRQDLQVKSAATVKLQEKESLTGQQKSLQKEKDSKESDKKRVVLSKTTPYFERHWQDKNEKSIIKLLNF